MFVELISPSNPTLSPGQQQREAMRLFPDLIRRSAMHLWNPGDPIQQTGRRLLIGIAAYSMLELKLLDRLEEYLRAGNDGRVDLFNTDDCKSHDDFCKYIPSLYHVLQTPVVGLWIDGTFSHSATGKLGRNMAEQFMGVR